jgi:DNA-directed RNA polymerase specialized sigma24 family protein
VRDGERHARGAKLARAVAWLRAALAHGPRRATEVIAQARAAGITYATLMAAKACIGVLSRLRWGKTCDCCGTPDAKFWTWHIGPPPPAGKRPTDRRGRARWSRRWDTAPDAVRMPQPPPPEQQPGAHPPPVEPHPPPDPLHWPRDQPAAPAETPEQADRMEIAVATGAVREGRDGGALDDVAWAVDDALALMPNLSPRDRELVRALVVDRLTPRAIALRRRITANAVRVWKHRLSLKCPRAVARAS